MPEVVQLVGEVDVRVGMCRAASATAAATTANSGSNFSCADRPVLSQPTARFVCDPRRPPPRSISRDIVRSGVGRRSGGVVAVVLASV